MGLFSGAIWNGLFIGPTTWPSHSYVLQQDVHPNTLHVLDDGIIKMVHVTSSGDECVIDVRRSPTLIGWPFIIEQRPSALAAVTVTKCSLRACPAPSFFAALAEDPTREAEFQRWQSTETLHLWDRTIAMSLRSSTARLEHFLGSHDLGGEGRGIPNGLTQSLLASLLNVTPEHLSRVMKRRSTSEPARAR
jgi:CRP-like cAMP-binding protein